jgi:probable HAF family extracellular repeat protein
LNDVGRVAGYYFPSGQGFNHGFITGPDRRGMRDLGLAASSIYDDAADINEAGQVVESSTPTPSSKTAFITGSNGESIRDLGSLGEDVSIARASSCRLSSDRFIARRKKMDGEAISLG